MQYPAYDLPDCYDRFVVQWEREGQFFDGEVMSKEFFYGYCRGIRQMTGIREILLLLVEDDEMYLLPDQRIAFVDNTLDTVSLTSNPVASVQSFMEEILEWLAPCVEEEE